MNWPNGPNDLGAAEIEPSAYLLLYLVIGYTQRGYSWQAILLQVLPQVFLPGSCVSNLAIGAWSACASD